MKHTEYENTDNWVLPLRPGKTLLISLVLFLILVSVSILALTTGAYAIDLKELFDLAFLQRTTSDDLLIRDILFKIRLPRVLMAASVGGGLALSGLLFQILLRNVLADPYILGVSGGASVGALFAILTGAAAVSIFTQPLFAFFGALIVIALVALIGLRPAVKSDTLLLSGVMIGAFLSSVILVLVSTTDKSIRTALFWLIGYLGNTTMPQVAIVGPVVLFITACAVAISGKLNIIALGEATASQLGIRINRLRTMVFFLASMSTAVVVSFVGAIGFVGLVIPHLCRLIIGPDNRILLPAVFLLGAAFVILSDLIARTILQPIELPVGAVTAALGAPLFLFLLLHVRK